MEWDNEVHLILSETDLKYFMTGLSSYKVVVILIEIAEVFSLPF